MSKQTDAKDIYNLMLSALKSALSKDEVDLKAIDLALKFVSRFDLEIEDNEDGEKDVASFLKTLPFKKAE